MKPITIFGNDLQYKIGLVMTVELGRAVVVLPVVVVIQIIVIGLKQTGVVQMSVVAIVFALEIRESAINDGLHDIQPLSAASVLPPEFISFDDLRLYIAVRLTNQILITNSASDLLQYQIIIFFQKPNVCGVNQRIGNVSDIITEVAIVIDIQTITITGKKLITELFDYDLIHYRDSSSQVIPLYYRDN
jgi:hypothetical protein